MSLQACFDLREESQKSWKHHVCDELVYVPESFAILTDSELVGMSGVSLPEIYLKDDAWIELQFSLVGEGNAHYVAIIESLNAKIKRILPGHGPAVGWKPEDVSPCHVWKGNDDFTSVRGDSPMLVEVTESIQSPEGVRFVGFPSVVRLKRFDFLDGSRGNSSELPVPSLDVPVFGGPTIEDGELGRFRRICTCQARQTPNDLIETGTHIVEGVADRQTGVIRDITELAFKTIPLLFKIVVSPHSVSLRSGELFQQRVQSIQMHLRPTKFQIGIGQSGQPRNTGRGTSARESDDLGRGGDPFRHPQSVPRDVKG